VIKICLFIATAARQQTPCRARGSRQTLSRMPRPQHSNIDGFSLETDERGDGG
jgi:hypothetical protein